MGKVKLYIVCLLAVSITGLTIINLVPLILNEGSTGNSFVQFFKSLSKGQAFVGAASTGTLTVVILFGMYKLNQFQVKK
ncbi:MULTISPECIES: hypothetical protein [unclassified Sporosarcina]|uniref:hypothetical protein n=1 Tax=unclassified Sporosarcina TaxID=2647733 RepID=UPI001A90E744|nr:MULTISPECIES: hypothetical protein [unclassified Sporosarcina]MBO0587597.1 hypothetical protein [Sporosarcina sp. E16_8]MBO0602415.1 hypothetical protein [Sporosarcina sp. E16_3]